MIGTAISISIPESPIAKSTPLPSPLPVAHGRIARQMGRNGRSGGPLSESSFLAVLRLPSALLFSSSCSPWASGSNSNISVGSLSARNT